MTRPRAVVVVTGSELVRGERRDLNGPFLASALLRLGIDPARIVIVGDGEEQYLVRGRRSVLPVTGLAAAVTRHLVDGLSWAEALAALSHERSVPLDEVRIAAWAVTSSLRSAGYLQDTKGEA